MALKGTCETLKKIADDEPMFVLRAQDKLAPLVIEFWCNLLEASGGDPRKIENGRVCAVDSRFWGQDPEHPAKLPD